MEKKENTILKSSINLIILAVIFKGLGFIKQAVIAYYFGASVDMDAYFIAYGFITGFSEAFIKALGVIMISIYTRIKIEQNKEELDKFVSGILEILIPLSIVIILLIYFFAPQIANILAPNATMETVKLLITFIKILSLAVLFISVEVVCSSVLESRKKFAVTKLKSFIYSLTVILFCVCISKFVGVKTLIAAYYISNIIFIIMLLAMLKKYFRWIFINPFKNKNIKEVFIKTIPLIIGNSIIQINQLVDKSIVSGLGEGYASVLSYCQILEQFVTSILIVNIGNVMLAYFSEYIAQKDYAKIEKALNNIINTLVCILLVVTCITIGFSNEIVKITYYRGSFSLEAVHLTAIALSGYAISFAWMAIRDVLNKSIYAFGNTKIPMINSVISIIVNIISSIWLAKKIGILGISLGTSIGVTIGAILNMISIKKFIKNYKFKSLYITFLKNVIPISLVSIIILIIKRCETIINNVIFLAVTIIILLLLYFTILYIENVKEVKSIVNKWLNNIIKKIYYNKSE